MGRGDAKYHRVIHPSENPSVKIGISISTPATLNLTSNQPFKVTVTARLLESSQPGAITLWTHLTPLISLSTGCFENIKCTTSDKVIDIYPHVWPHYVAESEDLHRDDHITIPAHGSVSVKHEIPREAINAAQLKDGEHYHISFVYQYMGTKWWCYGSLDDLKDVRLRLWRREPEFGEGYDDDMAGRIAEERREQFGDGPSTMGEYPPDLALIAENEAEFEIVGNVTDRMQEVGIRQE